MKINLPDIFMSALVDVYPYRITSGSPQFLILKRADNKQYAGQWRMVAGKVEKNEKAWEAALRELKEETSLTPELFWNVPSINQFYEAAKDMIHHIPVFAAKINAEPSIKLNAEHTEFKWIASSQVTTFIRWSEQQRLITLINTLLTTQYILNEWKITL